MGTKGGWKHSAETKAKIGAKTSERYRKARLESLTEPDHKRCSGCKVVKPIAEFHSRRYEIKDGYREGPEARCKACKYADYKKWKERKQAEGVDFYALWLRYNRKGRTVKGKRLRAARERERRAIKRREEGRPIARPRSYQLNSAGERLPPAPLLELLEKELSLKTEGSNQFASKGIGALVESSGLSERRLYGLLHDEYKLVSLSTVDKILTGLGLPHMLPILYPED